MIDRYFCSKAEIGSLNVSVSNSSGSSLKTFKRICNSIFIRSLSRYLKRILINYELPIFLLSTIRLH